MPDEPNEPVEKALARLASALVRMRKAQSKARWHMQRAGTGGSYLAAQRYTQEADDARLDVASEAYAIANALDPSDEPEED